MTTVKENPHCLVCNGRVGVSTRNSMQIFSKESQTCSERPLSFIMTQVLGTEIKEDAVHSLLVCKKCYKLFDEVDELERRLLEIKVELVTNYKNSVEKAKEAEEEGESMKMQEDSNVQEEGNKENEVPKKILDIPSSDDDNTQETAKNSFQTIEDIELELQKIHGEAKTDISKDVHTLELDDSSQTFGSFENSTGAIEPSSDSEFDPSTQDNTEALLQAAENAEKSLEEKTVKVKTEPEEDKPNILKKKLLSPPSGISASKKLHHSKKIKEEYLPPIVNRVGSEYVCLLCDSDADGPVCGEAKPIIAHMKEKHDLRLYICDVCGQEFRKRNELSLHVDEHVALEEGDFQCEVCNRIFSNLRLFRIHKRMHYPQNKAWTCDICGKRYSSRNLLDEHINTHTGIRPYVCQLCGKDFASKYTFKAHEKTHEVRPRPYECQQCGKTFLSQQNLTQHERTHSGIKEYSCHLCGKQFGSSHNLEVHSIVHTGYKPFVCGLCGKAFARKAEIRDHERTHTGERPYQCEFCGATFSQRSNLQSHKRATHYDDKRYKCEDCGKGFKRRRLLDYHIKAAHTGERPFKCAVCQATFVYPEHFKKHRRIHTGEKPFHCEVCGKAFNSRDNRNAHRFVHSDKKPYECLVCGAGFMRKPLLYQHMQAQGHLNDTIVVNQPRLTTDDDQIITVNAEGEMEIVEGDISQLQNMENADDDSKLYIAEQMLIENNVFGNSKGTVIVGDHMEDENEGTEAVEHIIINGRQVEFTEEEEDPEDNDGEEGQELIAGEDYESIITSEALANGETQIIETEDGPIHLMKVKIPNEDGEEEDAWVKIVHE